MGTLLDIEGPLRCDAMNTELKSIRPGRSFVWRMAWLVSFGFAVAMPWAEAADLDALREEVRAAGWLVFSAPGEGGTWDLFAARPDGSERRPLTRTADFHEAGPRVSADGRQLLFYRAPKAAVMENNNYGTFELMIARGDPMAPRSLGQGHAWASWSPDGTRLACLAPDGLHVIESATGKPIGERIPRRGIVQQLVWSPDGSAFTGTANGLGAFWNIGVMPAAGDRITAVSETARYNCTPDWTPDSQFVLYARGIVGGESGYAELWRAHRDGSQRERLHAEAGTHLYGACASPDGRHLVFTRSRDDLGGRENQNISMAVISMPPAGQPARRSSADPVRLDLGPGWEPHWTRHTLWTSPTP
jgi:Tol biopolymer transport system component